MDALSNPDNIQNARSHAKRVDRDGANSSLWQTGITAQPTGNGTVTSSQIFDTLIVGAGITGLTTALLLQKEGIDPARIKGYEQCEYTHAAVAAFVASGMADAGYGVETPARQFQLDFIPSQTERYCLICHEKSLASPALKQMLTILRSTKYRAAVNALPGYKVQKAGVVMDLREAFAAGAAGKASAHTSPATRPRRASGR